MGFAIARDAAQLVQSIQADGVGLAGGNLKQNGELITIRSDTHKLRKVRRGQFPACFRGFSLERLHMTRNRSSSAAELEGLQKLKADGIGTGLAFIDEEWHGIG